MDLWAGRWYRRVTESTISAMRHSGEFAVGGFLPMAEEMERSLLRALEDALLGHLLRRGVGDLVHQAGDFAGVGGATGACPQQLVTGEGIDEGFDAQHGSRGDFGGGVGGSPTPPPVAGEVPVVGCG